MFNVLCACLLSCAQLFVSPQTVASQALCPWDSPGENPGVGCHALVQGIFLTQGANPHLLWLLHCRQVLYCWTTREATWCILMMISLKEKHSFQSLAAQRNRHPLLCLNFGDWLNREVFSFLVGGASQPPIASTVQNSLMWMSIVVSKTLSGPFSASSFKQSSRVLFISFCFVAVSLKLPSSSPALIT